MSHPSSFTFYTLGNLVSFAAATLFTCIEVGIQQLRASLSFEVFAAIAAVGVVLLLVGSYYFHKALLKLSWSLLKSALHCVAWVFIFHCVEKLKNSETFQQVLIRGENAYNTARWAYLEALDGRGPSGSSTGDRQL